MSKNVKPAAKVAVKSKAPVKKVVAAPAPAKKEMKASKK